MIWHLILKPIYNLLFGNRRARADEDAYWEQRARDYEWRKYLDGHR